jgi:hypothetical protein
MWEKFVMFGVEYINVCRKSLQNQPPLMNEKFAMVRGQYTTVMKEDFAIVKGQYYKA